MAIKNTEGNYLRIVNFRIGVSPQEMDYDYQIERKGYIQVKYYLYKDENSRTNGLGPFETVSEGDIDIINFEYTYDSNKTLLENLLTGLYVSLKRLPAYEDWIDC